MVIDIFGVIIDLCFKAVELVFLIRGNTAVAATLIFFSCTALRPVSRCRFLAGITVTLLAILIILL